MTCPTPSLLEISDGTTTVTVPGDASHNGSVSKQQIGAGMGEVEYADGSAKLWHRYERIAYVFSASGLAPHGLWALDLTVASWTAAVMDPDDIGSTLNLTIVPTRPTASARDINTGVKSWSIELRKAAAET